MQACWDYGYDPAGNITTVQNSTGSTAVISNRSHKPTNQIDSIGGGGPTLVRGTLDEPGQVSVGIVGSGDKPARMLSDNRFEAELLLTAGTNALSIDASDTSGNRSTYQFNVSITNPSPRSFTYDDDGNLTSDGVRDYQWDILSRLTKITWATGKTTDFKYNALGQRCERIDTNGGTVTRHYYLINGADLIDHRSGSTAATATIDRRYFNQGEQRKNGTNWENHFYCRDHLGSIREVVKSVGGTNTLAARYDYDPYGRRLTQYESSTYAGGCDFGCTGHLTIPSLASGQMEMVMTLFRAYDPELGIWLSADPLGEAGGMNLYAYCFRNPLNLYDPDGLRPEWMLTNAEIGDALSDGFFATLDGAIPFFDPFQNAGMYGPCESGVGTSQALGGVARDVGFAAATGGAAFLRGGASRVLAGSAKSGIYEFSTVGGRYVGQSSDIAARIAGHNRTILSAVKTWAVKGGQTAREIAEQARIDKLGGIKALANDKNPIGLARKHLMDLYITADSAAGYGAMGGALIHGLDFATSSSNKCD